MNSEVNRGGDLLYEVIGPLLGWAMAIAALLPLLVFIYLLRKRLGDGQRDSTTGNPAFQLRTP